MMANARWQMKTKERGPWALVARSALAARSALVGSLAFVGSLALVATGCTSLSRSYPERAFYVIEVHRETEPRAVQGDLLAVRGLRVSPGFESRQLVYATGEGRFDADFYHQFFVPAPVMITDAIHDWLASCGLFEGVVGAGSLTDNVTFPALMLFAEAKTIRGCMYGSVNPRVDFPNLLSLYRHKRLDLDRMVTNTYTIDEAPQAFDDLEKGRNARGVILFD